VRPYAITNDYTTIGMPPGIGDLHWIMAKLESFKEINNIQKIKVLVNLGHQEDKSFHDCSLDYLKLIPFVDSAESVIDKLPFEYSLAGGSGTSLFKNQGGCDYMIEFNSKLEQGAELKDILPEYEINFDYPINEPAESKEFAEKIKKKVGGKLALLFTASVEGNDVWAKELWTGRDWLELARKIYAETKCNPVIIGARWDESYYTERIKELDTESVIYSVLGETSVAHLFALLRAASVLVAYQCGVVMMATKFRTPTAGFWPIKSDANPYGQFKRHFMRNWLPPWADDVGFHPFGFGDKNATPEGLFSVIRSYL